MPTESPLLEYGRTSPDGLAASGSEPERCGGGRALAAAAHFYKMLQTGESLLRRRLNDATQDEFSVLVGLATRRG